MCRCAAPAAGAGCCWRSVSILGMLGSTLGFTPPSKTRCSGTLDLITHFLDLKCFPPQGHPGRRRLPMHHMAECAAFGLMAAQPGDGPCLWTLFFWSRIRRTYRAALSCLRHADSGTTRCCCCRLDLTRIRIVAPLPCAIALSALREPALAGRVLHLSAAGLREPRSVTHKLLCRLQDAQHLFGVMRSSDREAPPTAGSVQLAQASRTARTGVDNGDRQKDCRHSANIQRDSAPPSGALMAVAAHAVSALAC